MGLEVATFISGLNANNPVGATDPKSQGDDHLRLIKATLLNTFPNISGAMNASHTELNNLVGVTGKTGSGNIVLSNAPSFTGLISGLAGNGAALTSLNASNIASGILADARLSSNVPLKDATNTFTSGRVYITSTSARLRLIESDATADEGTWDVLARGDIFQIRGLNDALSVSEAALNITRTGSNIDSFAITADSATVKGSEILTNTSNINTDQLLTDFANDASTAFTVGNGDAESIRRFTSASPITITLPNNIPTGWAVGDSMGIIRGGTGTLTFSSAGTIRSPSGNSITVQNGKAVITLVASGVWELSGNL